ncbi:putative Leucine Rich Repeat [Trypanosoma vivax]|uniref:Leucine-rich repeat protein (LRRP) n=1 Tax=Trypanosoma vivax (strain Y486) TaxID=1055687 RepID=G0U3P5_TRYVY|nr:hypothetical protein TRVL_03263 [Trypanosoma vivax]KAH8614045.1 putative Leucine Rich Repeat [Trypanosoma vivax]CCC50902.1 conserved hypothetical protein [Trypanosoma vivax Y486]
MELRLSHKGIQFFDATTLLLGATDKGCGRKTTSQKEHRIAVSLLDLSHNRLTSFVGAQTLLGLRVLDLSNNSLESLDVASLPGSLILLNVAHNALQSLSGLSTAVPKLKEFNASFNRLTSSGLSDLPRTLVTVSCHGNLLESVDPFVRLSQLHSLDVSSNRVGDVKELLKLRALPALRQLEMRGNSVMHQPDAVPLLLEAVPKLARLDRTPLSQVYGNQMFKAQRSRSANRSHSASSVSRASACSTTAVRRMGDRSERDMEVRLLETRIKELKRLVEDAEKSEQQLRYQKKILQEQVGACAGVIDSQALELERLEREIIALKHEEAALEEPATELEQTFTQTHASLVARRLSQSSECIRLRHGKPETMAPALAVSLLTTHSRT